MTYLKGQVITTMYPKGGAPIVLMIHNELFDPGALWTTEGIDKLLTESPDFQAFVRDALNRHCSGDWGNVDQNDREANDLSVKEGGRIMSVYSFPPMPKIWIITEADRSRTSVLLPDEY